MKFGIRTPSFKKRLSARTSWKRVVRHNMGFKAPRGFGWFTNPKRAAYNRIYSRTTVSADKVIGIAATGIFAFFGSLFSGRKKQDQLSVAGDPTLCPQCNSPMVQRDGSRGKFLGCSNFPRCRGTREIPKIEENKS